MKLLKILKNIINYLNDDFDNDNETNVRKRDIYLDNTNNIDEKKIYEKKKKKIIKTVSVENEKKIINNKQKINNIDKKTTEEISNIIQNKKNEMASNVKNIKSNKFINKSIDPKIIIDVKNKSLNSKKKENNNIESKEPKISKEIKPAIKINKSTDEKKFINNTERNNNNNKKVKKISNNNNLSNKLNNSDNKLNKDLEKDYLKEILKLIKKDEDLCNDIENDLKLVNSKFKSCINEKDGDKLKEKIKELEKLIDKLKEKYYFILYNNDFKSIDKNYFYLKDCLDYNDFLDYTITDEKILSKEKEIILFIEDLRVLYDSVKKNEEIFDKNMKIKKTRLSSLEKEKEIINDVNDLTSIILKDQERTFEKIKEKVGKIDIEKITKTKMVFDYDKLLNGPVALAGLTAKMPLLATTKIGMFLGVLGINKSLKNTMQMLKLETYDYYKVHFENFENALNNGLSSLDNCMNLIDDSINTIENIRKDINKYYIDKNDPDFINIMNKLYYLNTQLNNKKSLINSSKKHLDDLKDKNDKGKYLARKKSSDLNK